VCHVAHLPEWFSLRAGSLGWHSGPAPTPTTPTVAAFRLHGRGFFSHPVRPIPPNPTPPASATAPTAAAVVIHFAVLPAAERFPHGHAREFPLLERRILLVHGCGCAGAVRGSGVVRPEGKAK